MASALYATFFTIFLLMKQSATAQHSSHLIMLGSSLSPIKKPTSWLSPLRRFAFGFYQEGDSFRVGIWLVGELPDRIITWTANRDNPPVSSRVSLELTTDGRFILRNHFGKDDVFAELPEPAACAAMLDSGFLEVYNNRSRVIWASSSFPTDTILGGQSLHTNTARLSSVSETNHSTGRFLLKMQNDGNLVLYPRYADDTGFFAYWASDTFGQDRHYYLHLNESGVLYLINSTNSTMFTTLNHGSVQQDNSAVYRATLGYDGIFRLFSHVFDKKGHYNKSILWSKPDSVCDVKGFCGFNSYCTFNDVRPICLCIPGTDYLDPNQQFLGCERNFVEEKCRSDKENAGQFNMSVMEEMKWEDIPYLKVEMSEGDCSRACLDDCNCEVAQFQKPYCMKQKLPIRYVRRDRTEQSKTFFKIGSMKRRNITGSPNTTQQPEVIVKSNASLVLILVTTAGFITCSCVALAISGFFFFKFRLVKYRGRLELGGLGMNQELSLRPFSYSELKKATNGFKEKLGGGSFGTVYKGALHKGKKIIAVKRLEKLVNEGEREFLSEMRVIAKIHHKNLVRLLGYCAENSKRLLVYEYMTNGSLADLLFRADRWQLDWNERVRIAREVARGILYLHEECEVPVIHCDIKPQNILIDACWTAKISDFGLAKLLMPDQTRTFTTVRGTRGYLAPEWQKNIPISVKADVYSYGVVLLEIVCCRKNMDANARTPEEIILSSWAYKCLISNQLNKVVYGQDVDKKSLEKMIKVGLWCIQDEPALRPSMKSVVMLLEGITDIAIPPCPSSASA